MIFGIYGTSSNIVSGIPASVVAPGIYADIIQNLSSLNQIVGISGVYQGYSYNIIADSLHSNDWNLVITSSNIGAGNIYLTSNLGTSVNPVFAGGALQVSANGTVAQYFTVDTSSTNTIDQNGQTSTFSGVFSDATSGGVLTFVNTGTGGAVTLTGTNTYTGGTTINTGATVLAGNNAAFGTGTVAMAAGSTTGFAVTGLTLSNGFTVSGDPTFTTASGGTDTVSGVIADGGSPGTVVVAGSGTLVLTGTNTYTGGTAINSGATLQIGAGGQIGPGTVDNSGNLILSTPQTITGNYTQTGTLTINASGATTGGRMTTSGSAIMPNAQVVFATQGNFVPAKGSVYTLVAASSSGTSYTGDRLTLNAPGYTGLFNLATANVGGNSDLVIQFQRDPTIYVDTLMTLRGAFLAVADAVGGQMRAMRGAPGDAGTASVAGPNDNTVWITGTGQFLHTSSGGGAPGYSSSGGGAVVGVDHAMAPDLRLGVALGVSDQAINGGNGMSYDGQAMQMQLYGSAQRGIGFVDAQLGGVLSQGTAKRTMFDASQAQGNVTGSGLGASVRGGARYGVGDWNLEPSVTLGGLALAQNALSETGPSGGNLRIGRGTLNSLYTMPGLEVDHRFTLGTGYALVAAARAGWMHEMLDTNSQLSAATQGASSLFGAAPIGRDAADLALHMELETSSSLRLFARYETMLARRGTSQMASGGLKYTW